MSYKTRNENLQYKAKKSKSKFKIEGKAKNLVLESLKFKITSDFPIKLSTRRTSLCSYLGY